MDIKEENNKQLKAMYNNLKLMRQSRAWSIEELSEISGINKKFLPRLRKVRILMYNISLSYAVFIK